VAGSLSAFEDCYRPDLVPPADECLDEHSERIQHVLESGVDLLLIETMNSIREAVIAAKIATDTGLPTWVTFVCNEEGRILSGESLTNAAEKLMPLGVKAMGVNCMPAHTLAHPLTELRVICVENFPLLAYGSIGHVDDEQGWINTELDRSRRLPATRPKLARTNHRCLLRFQSGTHPQAEAMFEVFIVFMK
jgi:S-methylmethionine-dependent homocysteine/selenocysteine methylase